MTCMQRFIDSTIAQSPAEIEQIPVVGFLASASIFQPERRQIQSGACAFFLHAGFGDGTLPKCHYQTAPENGQILKAATVLCQQVDFAQRGLVRVE